MSIYVNQLVKLIVKNLLILGLTCDMSGVQSWKFNWLSIIDSYEFS